MAGSLCPLNLVLCSPQSLGSPLRTPRHGLLCLLPRTPFSSVPFHKPSVLLRFNLAFPYVSRYLSLFSGSHAHTPIPSTLSRWPPFLLRLHPYAVLSLCFQVPHSPLGLTRSHFPASFILITNLQSMHSFSSPLSLTSNPCSVFTSQRPHSSNFPSMSPLSSPLSLTFQIHAVSFLPNSLLPVTTQIHALLFNALLSNDIPFTHSLPYQLSPSSNVSNPSTHCLFNALLSVTSHPCTHFLLPFH